MRPDFRARGRVLAVAATAVLLSSDRAAVASPQPPELLEELSTLTLRIGGSPDIGIAMGPVESFSLIGSGSLLGPSTGYYWFPFPPTTLWTTVNFGPGTSLFTGVPLISNLEVTVHNDVGFLQSGFFVSQNPLGPGSYGPGLGGVLRLSGQAVIHALAGSIRVPIDLRHVGGLVGETTMVTLSSNDITIFVAPFITAPVVITQITSNVITIPARGNLQGVGFTLQPTALETVMTPSTNGGYASIDGGNAFEVHTVTVSGDNSIDPGSGLGIGGSFTVVSPLRIDTAAIAGRLPGAVSMRVAYSVPEPSGLLMLVCGVIGLLVIGRGRMRR